MYGCVQSPRQFGNGIRGFEVSLTDPCACAFYRRDSKDGIQMVESCFVEDTIVTGGRADVDQFRKILSGLPAGYSKVITTLVSKDLTVDSLGDIKAAIRILTTP
jgi:hypothetical protein